MASFPPRFRNFLDDAVEAFAFASCIWSWYRPHKYGVVPICGYGLVTLGEFGVVPLRENVPGIFLLFRAGGYQLVHGPGSTENIMMGHSCHINGVFCFSV